MYKHGGTATDTNNCGSLEFHPTSFDVFACYPDNKDKGYVPNSAPVPLDAARDAIKQFCNRKGKDQTYTLDPEVSSSDGVTHDFIQNTCTEEGFAACTYGYTNDGKRVKKKGESGDFGVGIKVHYFHMKDLDCRLMQEYEIQGARLVFHISSIDNNWFPFP